MKISHLFIVILAFATYTARPVHSQTLPSTQPADPRIAALIRSLGDAQYQSRQKAQDELIALGVSAEPALRIAVADSANPEIRSRASAAIAEIEARVADSPTYITLHVKNVSAQSACDEIARQAKTTIACWPPQAFGNRPTITLDIDHKPFWPAIQDFCSVAGASPGVIGSNFDTITLMQRGGNPAPPPMDQEGLFTVLAQTIQRNSQVDLATGHQSDFDALGLSIYADPKSRIIQCSAVQVRRAVDENGVSMVPDPSPQGGFFYGAYPAWSVQTNVPLKFPAKAGARLAVLEGSVVVEIPQRTEVMRIPDLAKSIGKTFKAGMRQVVIDKFSLDGGQTVHLHATVSDLSPPVNQVVRFGVVVRQGPDLFGEFRAAHIIDANGKSLSISGGGMGSENSIEYEGTGTSDDPRTPLAPPFSLVWNVVTQVKNIELKFGFKDLPLPQ